MRLEASPQPCLGSQALEAAGLLIAVDVARACYDTGKDLVWHKGRTSKTITDLEWKYADFYWMHVFLCVSVPTSVPA